MSADDALKVWVVLPTYNEAENLPPMLDALLRLKIPALDVLGVGGWGSGIGPWPLAPGPHPPSPGPRSVSLGYALAPNPQPPTSNPQPASSVLEPPPEPGRNGHGTSRKTAHGEPVEPYVLRPAQDEGTQEPAFSAAAPSGTVFVLVVDDGSPDGTGRIAEEVASENPGRVHVLHRAGKLGLGTAYVQGFTFALQRGADVVVEMDADFSHSPEYLARMIALLSENDVVVGSRWCPGGKLDANWELWRYLLSKYANVYARTVTGLRVRDTTAGFKVFRGEALRSLPYARVRSNGYAFQIEMATECQRAGLRVTEYPIYFADRAHGRSKMTVGIILDAVWRVWQIRFRR